MARIAVVDRDVSNQRRTRRYLLRGHHIVTAFRSIQEAITAHRKTPLEAICFTPTGEDLSSTLKEIEHPLPIIVFGSQKDVGVAENGTLHLLPSPISAEELLQQVTTLTHQQPSRRHFLLNDPHQREIFYLSLSPGSGEVIVNDQTRVLTETELDLLNVLLDHAPAAVSRADLIQNALGYRDTIQTRTADVHIKNIRAKLGPGRWIETARRVGYRFIGEHYTIPQR